MNKNLLKNIINNSKTWNLLAPIDENDDFPTGGGGLGTEYGGGTGGGISGTTSANILPSLTISPSENQSIATGTTLCIKASGVIAFPQEVEQAASLSGGCSATTSGTWIKNCGSNLQYDAEAYDPTLIYRYRPFQFTGTNSSFNNPGSPYFNTHLLLGVKTTGGYKFFWEVYRYCNADGSSHCSSRWFGVIKVAFPNGTETTLSTGYVEFNQQFRIRSDGTLLSWDYTTFGRWAYSTQYMVLPADVGDFQPIVNGLWTNNTWDNLRIFKGSYQGTPRPEDYNWTSDCLDSIVVTGDKACYTPIIPGYCKVCVSTLNLEPKCVSIISSPLSLKPVNRPCDSCDNANLNCENIPNPTPVVINLELVDDSINIFWDSSISFTNGLYYEININEVIETTLDPNATINNLEVGSYTISVRAIDTCGQSDWSTSQIIEVI